MDCSLYNLRSFRLIFLCSSLLSFARSWHVPFTKSSPSTVYGPIHWSSILCPFDVFCSMFLRRTVSPLLKVNFRPPVLLRYCCFCFCWATSMFLSILGKTASLISVIFSICACKLLSEHSSVITLLIASSPSSRGVTNFSTSNGIRGCRPNMTKNGLHLVVVETLVLIAKRAPSM